MNDKKAGAARNSFLANFGAGDYGPVDRAMRVLGNIGRKIVRRQMCCGNYGDPGC